ncbi:4-hydroxy-tetrahydrodipicolinate reductase [Ferruginivarius sediminum]|uniref:4-hydroxy-tetrahydrodipicolinate reductase n=1 Tax=Ferruginivarius sediminum TaxID=2661937 RepID=A0A369TE19_9PROT|nr:4-hydroxy-tetrahydrodipicolinate reductase [Ferruginivarius sediminum]RDD63579.1 4-hydroxy-tetrahydrodipicolinate reductase [Ferruginivarius sediminum]
MRIGIAGCKGRMGKMLVQAVVENPDCELAGGTVREGDPAAGEDIGTLFALGETGAKVLTDPVELFAASDAVIDFTKPELAARHADLAAQSKVALIMGTTGLGEAEQEALNRAARHTQVVQAPNMSLGVNLLLDLVEQVARALDPGFDIEIAEMHHRHKVDAPSGTALALGKAAAAGRGVDLDEVADRGRDGHTGARREGDIGFAVLRGGDVAGEHTVVFAGAGERIELTHKAGSRAIFAQGAVKAAVWANRQDPGLYSMKDVLGL